VAHYQIRNRGTVGGSVAHADPAAEMPGIAVACDAEIAVTGRAGSRVIRADDFFIAPLTTALAADEIITEIRLPPWPAQRRWGFREFSRRRGDFAMAAAAVFFDVDDAGKARNAHIAAIGIGGRPTRLREAEAEVNGKVVDVAISERAARAASASVNPQSDIHASGAYRKSLIGTMVERALQSAAG
jgi:carbon-monoxide dehydrogenase medium subunit